MALAMSTTLAAVALADWVALLEVLVIAAVLVLIVWRLGRGGGT